MDANWSVYNGKDKDQSLLNRKVYLKMQWSTESALCRTTKDCTNKPASHQKIDIGWHESIILLVSVRQGCIDTCTSS